MSRLAVLRLLSLSLALLLGAAARPATAGAQVGSTTDILTGVVRNPAGEPIEGANVEAFSLETQVTRRARTNGQGRYTILFPDGGGQYRVTVRFLGFAPATVTVARQADEDRLVANVNMSANATQIAGVQIRAPQTLPRDLPERPTPGSQERALNPDQLARLPIDQSDLAALAVLAPGVVAVSGTDSTLNAFSVAGQRTDANAITLDGLSFGASQVPQDAVRNTRVVTSTYDVARGQFSGGLVATTTRSGSNIRTGSFNYTFRNDDLAWQAGEESSFNSGYTQNQLSGGLGGPIIRDHLFWFGSAQVNRRTDQTPSLLAADDNDLLRLGTSPDSVNRFLDVLDGFGIPTQRASAALGRTNDQFSTLLRFDWLVSQAHTLTVRGDWRWTGQDPTRVGTLSLPQTGGDQTSKGGGAAIVLSSNFMGRFINELRAYVSRDERTSNPFYRSPAGRVQVAAALDDGSTPVTTYGFGGNSGLPQSANNSGLEITEELSWLSSGGGHRVKLGGLFNRSTFEQDVTTNRLGTYSFISLADLEAGRAATFTRTLAPMIREGTSMNAAAYLGDTWRVNRALQVVYGLRAEHSRFDGAPALNPLVEQSFGYRTDFIPDEWHVSPRVGFTWQVGTGAPPNTTGGPQRGAQRGGQGGGQGGGRGGPAAGPGGGFSASGFTIRGGIGEFRGTIPTQLFSQAQAATGLVSSEAQLVCTGQYVPAPDWSLFARDPSAIPTECLGGVSAPPTTARRNVTLFDPGFEAPRSWRASLGASRRLWTRYSISADVNLTRGVSQYGYTDLNLAATPRFRLAEEGNRPVYASAEFIDPATGAVGFTGSRTVPELGQVMRLTSDLSSRTGQATVSLNGITTRGALLNLSYTFARSRDQGPSGGFAAATTAANPNVREWGTSNLERRHQIVSTITYPFGQAIELTSIVRLASGTPFTPLIASDINGDGSRNDRAFIFDPSLTADTAIANGMRRLLAGSSGSVAGCLEEQMGKAATRNSCRGPWQPSLELQLNYRPNILGLQRKLSISLVTQNFLGGLDQLLHGANGLRGWGAFRNVDNTLLYVRGFDPVAQRFQYQVNERFGASRGANGGVVLPFQVGLQARYIVGPDRQREMIRAVAGMGRGPGGAGGPGGMFANLNRLLPNPVNQVLQRGDSLGLALTPEQIAKLTVVRDTLDARNRRIAEAVQKEVEKAGANPDPGALFGSLRPRLQEASEHVNVALKEMEATLTPEQWAKVPERLKVPSRVFGPGGAPQRRP